MISFHPGTCKKGGDMKKSITRVRGLYVNCFRNNRKTHNAHESLKKAFNCLYLQLSFNR